MKRDVVNIRGISLEFIIVEKPSKLEAAKEWLKKIIYVKMIKNMSQYLKPLHISAYFDGKLVNRVLIDKGPKVHLANFYAP